MKFNYKSHKGFTLIELLVVIGILAVLAAIAIPSVAGLIDRANVSADKTNSNEMTNAVERFASEYELYCQDIASGALDTDNLDSAQGRVKNVVGVTTRAGIEDLEIGQGETVADNVVAIYRDTKYPVNAETMKRVVENYTKTSSSTFEPKQSDMHYWYSPDCGVVVFAEPDALSDKENKLNAQIQSGMDAKGKELGPQTQWIDLTSKVLADDTVELENLIPINGSYIQGATVSAYGLPIRFNGDCSYDTTNATIISGGNPFPSEPQQWDIYLFDDYLYVYKARFDTGVWFETESECWSVMYGGTSSQPNAMLSTINGKPVTNAFGAYGGNNYIMTAPKIPSSVTNLWYTFTSCDNLTGIVEVPCHIDINQLFWDNSNITINKYHYDGCGH